MTPWRIEELPKFVDPSFFIKDYYSRGLASSSRSDGIEAQRFGPDASRVLDLNRKSAISSMEEDSEKYMGIDYEDEIFEMDLEVTELK